VAPSAAQGRQFLLERGFTAPDAAAGSAGAMAHSAYGGANAVQDTNQKLLSN